MKMPNKNNEYDFDFEYTDNEHSDSSHNLSDDDDSEEINVFSRTGKRKRRRGKGYETFENDQKPIKKSMQQRREEMIYGVFAESSKDVSKWKVEKFSTEITFVPSKAKTEKETEQPDENENKREEFTLPKEKDAIRDEDLKEEENMKIESNQSMDDANRKFLMLLNRGKEKNKHRRQQSNTDTVQSRGLGFHAADVGVHQSLSSSSFTKKDDVDGLDNDKNKIGQEKITSMNDFFSSSRNDFSHKFAERPKRTNIDPNIGKWEKHTKGIGMKLLTKMGFSGSGGLGKRNRGKQNQNQNNSVSNTNASNNSGAGVGISRPLEVVVRPTNLGLGYGNFKEASRLKVNRQLEAEVRGIPLVNDDDDDNDNDENLEKKNKNKRSKQQPLIPTTDSLLRNSAWKKNKGNHQKNKNKKETYTFVSYEDIIASSGEKENDNEMEIIDMRGPQPITSTASSLTSNVNTGTKSNKVMLGEELLHNVTLLVNTYESRLKMSQQLHISNQQKVKTIQNDVENLKARIKESQSRKDRMIEIQKLVDKIESIVLSYDGQKSSSSKPMLLEHTLPPLLLQLRSKFTPQEKQQLHLNDIIIPDLLSPCLAKYIESWKPLEEPHFIVDIIDLWRPLLSGSNKVHDNSKILSEHEENLESINNSIALHNSNLLIFKNLLIKIRQNILSKWDVFDSQPCLSLYQVLLAAGDTCDNTNKLSEDKDVMMESLITNRSIKDIITDLITDTILPKVKGALNELSSSFFHSKNLDFCSPQKWLLPWMPYINEASKAHLHNDIQKKVKNLLIRSSGNMNDKLKSGSIDYDKIEILYHIISPWKNIVSTSVIHTLVSNHIQPALIHALSSLEINPSNQDLRIIHLINKFHQSKLFPPHVLASLFEGEFCRNWINVLYNWVNNSKVNEKTGDLMYTSVMEEVAQFYLGWKKTVLIDLSLSNDEMIIRYFYEALKIVEMRMKLVRDKNDNDDLETLEPPSKETYNFRMALRRRKIEELERKGREQQIKDLNEDVSEKQRMQRFKFVRRSANEMTFRDAVESYALEHGILLIPRREGIDANARKDGKQVFNFGKIPIYLDENVVYACLKKEQSSGLLWDPISLDDLVTATETG